MTFKAYIDNIRAKTGKSSADFKKLADEKAMQKTGKSNLALRPGKL